MPGRASSFLPAYRYLFIPWLRRFEAATMTTVTAMFTVQDVHGVSSADDAHEAVAVFAEMTEGQLSDILSEVLGEPASNIVSYCRQGLRVGCR